MTIDKQKLNELQGILDPVMKYLSDNFHPHIQLRVDSEMVEILEGQATLHRSELKTGVMMGHYEFMANLREGQVIREQRRVAKIAIAAKNNGIRLRDIFTDADDVEHVDGCVFRMLSIAESNAPDQRADK